MRPFFFILFLFCLPPFSSVGAQDVATQYLKLQETYTQRVEDITQRYQKSQRELLNKFILALVRTEQGFRENGDLEGVVYCRNLREQLLLNPVFPEATDTAPPGISDMLDTLQEKGRENLAPNQQELDKLNFLLLQALSQYQGEFTRQGLFQKASEIQKLRAVLTHAHETTQAKVNETKVLKSSLSADPNLYPFALEGEAYGETQGLTPRKCMIDLNLHPEGLVEKVPTGYRFVNGRLTLPANQSGPLLQDIARNGMFSAEIAFQPSFDLQGYSANPVIIFQMGETLDTALFALTLEAHSIYLYLKTNHPPVGRENYRYEIGKLHNTAPVHICVTYRPGELTAYMNGVATLQLRNEVTGTFQKLEPVPVLIGKALSHPENNFIFPFRGTLNQVYLKAGDLSSRQVVYNYKRYLMLFE